MKKTSNRLHSLFAALAALILAAALAVPAFAVEGGFADLYYRMNDSAEVLTEDEDNELEADVQRTIEKIVELAPDSLTVHSLAIKRASRLNQWIQENGVSMLHNTDETMKIAAAGAEKLGMKPYYLYRQKNMSGNFENTGYARPGKYGLYNILIMEEKQTIVALGAGSITKRVFPDGRIERCDNVKDVGLYIEKIDEMIKRKRELFT